MWCCFEASFGSGRCSACGSPGRVFAVGPGHEACLAAGGAVSVRQSVGLGGGQGRFRLVSLGHLEGGVGDRVPGSGGDGRWSQPEPVRPGQAGPAADDAVESFDALGESGVLGARRPRARWSPRPCPGTGRRSGFGWRRCTCRARSACPWRRRTSGRGGWRPGGRRRSCSRIWP